MIARTWRGWTAREDADAYCAYLRSTGLREHRETPGNRAAYILRRVAGDRAEFVTLMLPDSLEAVRGFAGADVDQAVFYPKTIASSSTGSSPFRTSTCSGNVQASAVRPDRRRLEKEAIMRFLVVSTPRVPIPPDQLPGMIDRAEQWQERYADHLPHGIGIFPGGGGFGILDAPDEATVHRILTEMPFSPFSTLEVRVFVDSSTGWSTIRESLAAAIAHA